MDLKPNFVECRIRIVQLVGKHHAGTQISKMAIFKGVPSHLALLQWAA